MTRDDDAFFTELRDRFRAALEERVRLLDGAAELRWTEADPQPLEDASRASEGCWSLLPANERAAELRWHVAASDAWLSHLSLGRFTRVEICTTPTRPVDTALATLVSVVDAVVDGGFREEAWLPRAPGRPVRSRAHVRSDQHAPWRRIGELRARPLPFLRSRRYTREVWEYEPYRR